MPTSVRLDPKTQGALDRLARSRSQTRSEVVRQAICRIFTLDRRDFSIYRPDRLGSFDIVPADQK